MSNQEQTQRDRDLTEALRSGRTARGGAKLLSVLGGVLVILGVIAGGALPLLIAGAALLALGGWLGQKKAATVRQQIGDTVGLDALRAVFDEVEFAQDRHLSDSVPGESGIPLPRYTDCTGGEYAHCFYRGRDVELSSLTLTERYELQNEETNQWETRETVAWTGQWLVCRTGAAQPADLMLVPRGKLDRLFRTARIETGNEALDKRFTLTADDAGAARRFLSPARAERLLTLADTAGGGLSVRLRRDGTLHIAVQSGHGFFDSGKGRETAAALRDRFTRELRWFADLLDVLCPVGTP